jgi:hypothetical protein
LGSAFLDGTKIKGSVFVVLWLSVDRTAIISGIPSTLLPNGVMYPAERSDVSHRTE